MNKIVVISDDASHENRFRAKKGNRKKEEKMSSFFSSLDIPYTIQNVYRECIFHRILSKNVLIDITLIPILSAVRVTHLKTPSKIARLQKFQRFKFKTIFIW